MSDSERRDWMELIVRKHAPARSFGGERRQGIPILLALPARFP